MRQIPDEILNNVELQDAIRQVKNGQIFFGQYVTINYYNNIISFIFFIFYFIYFLSVLLVLFSVMNYYNTS